MGAKSSCWCPCPYSHAPTESLSVAPLLGTAQSHPPASPLWEAPLWPRDWCVFAKPTIICHITWGQRSSSTGGVSAGDRESPDPWREVAPVMMKYFQRGDQQQNEKRSPGQSKPTQTPVCCKQHHLLLGKAGTPTQAGGCPAQSFQQQLKLATPLQ